jgi:hypothetical protein
MKFFFRVSNKHNWTVIRDNFTKKLNEIIREASLAEGRDFQIELAPVKKAPTQNQRAFYFSVILPAINEHLRNEGSFYSDLARLDADIRDAIKDEFGLYREEENKLTGKTYKTLISLSNAKGDRGETRKYIEAVLCWAASFCGINIPNPYYK